MSAESKPPASDVAVWGNGSLFTHTIVSPALTVRPSGCEAGAVDRHRVGHGFRRVRRRGRAHARAEQAQHRGDGREVTERRSCLNGAVTSCPARLDVLGVLEVRDERRPDLDEQRLQLRVLARSGISVLSTASSTCW